MNPKYEFYSKLRMWLLFTCVLGIVAVNVFSMDTGSLKKIAGQMESESTTFINFSERKIYFDQLLDDLKLRHIPEIPYLNAYLSRLEKIVHLLNRFQTRADESRFDLSEHYAYFDVSMYNLIRINYLLNEQRLMQQLKLEFPARLLGELKKYFNKKTFQKNVIIRRSFIYDAFNSHLMEGFSASEKLRIKTYLNATYKDRPKDALSDTESIVMLMSSRMVIHQDDLIKPLYHFLPEDFIMKAQDHAVLEVPRPTQDTAESFKSLAKTSEHKKSGMNSMYLLGLGTLLLVALGVLLYSFLSKPVYVPVSKKERTKTTLTSLTPDLPKSVNLDPVLEMMVSGIPERYQGIGKLSKGGMGTIFLATDTMLNRKVAIKMIHPQFSDDEMIRVRFINEARAIAGLDHPHILKIYDVGIDPYPYFVMELLQGSDLDQILIKRGKFQGDELITYGGQLSDALLYCHKKGVLHRDIKPANVIVINGNASPSIRLVDFGIAKNTNMADVTSANVTMGSPLYMAPEQLQKGVYSQKTDIYAFGMTLYRMATGTLPFGPDQMALKLSTDPAPIWDHLPDFNKLLGAVIMKCIQREADQRLASMDQVLALFNKLRKAN